MILASAIGSAVNGIKKDVFSNEKRENAKNGENFWGTYIDANGSMRDIETNEKRYLECNWGSLKDKVLVDENGNCILNITEENIKKELIYSDKKIIHSASVRARLKEKKYKMYLYEDLETKKILYKIQYNNNKLKPGQIYDYSQLDKEDDICSFYDIETNELFYERGIDKFDYLNVDMSNKNSIKNYFNAKVRYSLKEELKNYVIQHINNIDNQQQKIEERKYW